MWGENRLRRSCLPRSAGGSPAHPPFLGWMRVAQRRGASALGGVAEPQTAKLFGGLGAFPIDKTTLLRYNEVQKRALPPRNAPQKEDAPLKPIESAEILCVGTELLLGDIVNTDAACLARGLRRLGINVCHQCVVGDNAGRLREALETALSRSDLVITSGGLGPTYDDLTKETVASCLGLTLQTDEASLDRIRDYFARTGRVMTENNEKQALVPTGARAIENDNGTAPGILIEQEATGKTVILLPGPPRELEPMFRDRVLPYLRGRTTHALAGVNIHIFGMGESAVETVLHAMMIEGSNPTVAPFCKEGEVRVRVTARADSREEALALCREAVENIRKTEVGTYIYGVADADGEELTMERATLEALMTAGRTVACAESCTGGLVAKRLTDIPGASAAVLGGCVTYTNEMKERLLGVRRETIARYTEVSEATAREMARGVRERTGADIGVSTTGFAGPGGGTETEPVGTVYVAVSTPQGESVRRVSLSPSRSRDYIRTVAATHALAMVREAASGMSRPATREV